MRDTTISRGEMEVILRGYSSILYYEREDAKNIWSSLELYKRIGRHKDWVRGVTSCNTSVRWNQTNACTYWGNKCVHITGAKRLRAVRGLDMGELHTHGMDDLNSTMEEYIRLEEEKARKHGKVFNWETAKYGKIWYDDDIHDLRSVETEFSAISLNDEVSSETLFCEPTVSSLHDEIDFRISFDDFDDEDYTVVFDKNSFSYKKISTNDLKTDLENNNEKVNLPSPKPTISCFDDLDFFKDFENEFPAIVYNDAQTSKLDLSTEPIFNPQHIDELDLNDETSLSECDEEEQNVLYFNDLFPFNVIYPNDSKLDKDNDDDKIDIKQSSGGNVINVDVGAYAHGSNKLFETSHDTINRFFKAGTFIKELNVNIMAWNYLTKGMPFIFIIKNLYVPFGIPFDPKLFYKDGSKLGQV
ncbi:hypothetical protein Tco_0083412 [Tanacetum coccineum]